MDSVSPTADTANDPETRLRATFTEILNARPTGRYVPDGSDITTMHQRLAARSMELALLTGADEGTACLVVTEFLASFRGRMESFADGFIAGAMAGAR